MVEQNGYRYYTAQEVCEITGYSRVTLFRRVKDGLIRQYKYKKSAVFRYEDVQAIIGKADLPVNEQWEVWYSPKELADLLGVGLTTIYRWQREGKLNGYKHGHYIRYKDDALCEIINELQTKCSLRGPYVNKYFRVI